MVLEEPGESGLFGQLKEHQLQQKTAATSASARGQPPGGEVSALEPYIASEMSVAPTGTVKSATRYRCNGTRQRTLRWARSITPWRPLSAAVTTNAPTPTPSSPPTNPCSGRPHGKVSASAIGRIAAVRKPAARPITMNTSTEWCVMVRSSADINPFLACQAW
jgi:hypothetical protein